ncbi:MAG: hypothetical protein IPK80_06535 [Nannocystis sp.]|nr:hypothetical protein [Nannocystis sp.]
MRSLRRIFRADPLVTFALVGALIFAIDRRLAGSEGGSIVVDAAWAAAIEASLARGRAAPPEPKVVAAAIHEAADEERLVREALALGLDRGDVIVRRRLAQKMRFLLEDRGAEAVGDAALLERLAARPERYERPALIAITQVFVDAGRHADAEARAISLKRALEGGAVAIGLGDPWPHGQQIGLRAVGALDGLFGDGFGAAAAGAEIGAWQALRSPYGWHVVRVDAYEAARPATLEEARARLLAEAQAEARAAAQAAAMAALRARYPLTLAEGLRPGLAAALAEGP